MIVAWQIRIEKMSTGVAAGVIFSLMCLVVADVFGRKAFNSPIQGSIEVTELTLVVMVYLSVSYVQARREHVKLELFSSRLSERALYGLNLLGLFIALVISVIIMWQVGLFAWDSLITDDRTMGIVEIPIWPSKVTVFFGFVLLCVRLIIDICGVLMGVDTGEAVDETVSEESA